MNAFTYLIIPVFNAEKILERTFIELNSYLQFRSDIKVIFVNDGSSDRTSLLLKLFVAEALFPLEIVKNNKNSGKGYSIKKGLSLCQDADIVGFTDVDLPYGLKKVDEAIRQIHEHTFDAVIGDRTQIRTTQQYSWYRKQCAHFFRLLLPSKIKEIQDTQSGLKFFRARVAEDVFSYVLTDRWVFDIEILLALLKKNYRVYQLPVWRITLERGGGGVSLFGHGIQIVKDLLSIYYRMWKENLK